MLTPVPLWRLLASTSKTFVLISRSTESAATVLPSETKALFPRLRCPPASLAPKLASTCESLPTLPWLRTRKAKPPLVPLVSSHIPVSGLHCGPKQGLVPGGQVTKRCVCTQLPASQPAVVQALLSVSGHVRSVHSSVAQGTGHWGMADDPWFPACRLLLHIASPSAKAAVCTKPKTSSMSKGVVSLCGPEVGSGLSTMRSNSRWQKF